MRYYTLIIDFNNPIDRHCWVYATKEEAMYAAMAYTGYCSWRIEFNNELIEQWESPLDKTREYQKIVKSKTLSESIEEIYSDKRKLYL